MTRLINRVSTLRIVYFSNIQSVRVAQRGAKPARDAHVPRARLVPNAPRERVQHRQVVVVAVVPVLVVLTRRPVQHAEPAPRLERRSRAAEKRRTDRSAPLAPTAMMSRPAARGVLKLEAPATRVACRNVRRARADDSRRGDPVVTGRAVTGRAVNVTQARDRRVRSRRLLRVFFARRIGSPLRRARGHTVCAPRRAFLRRRPVTRARSVTGRPLIIVRRVSA